MNALTIQERFARARMSGLRAREAAQAIGLSEGAVLAAHVGQHVQALKTQVLQGPWIELLRALQACGPLMALTRNESAVHEKTGVYQHISQQGTVGLALGEQIDLRLFFEHWHTGFWVSEASSKPDQAPQTSLQFFDAAGVAVHKIYSRPATDMARWLQVAQPFLAPTQDCHFAPAPSPPQARPDSQIDVAGFSQAWAQMTDTHQFFHLLKRFYVERQQGLRLVEGEFSRRVSTDALRRVFLEAALDATPLMVFVGSQGCIQIHTGPIQRVEPMTVPNPNPTLRAQPTLWLNILDPGFNLHLREDLVAHVWVVEKPSSDGVINSLEVFDTQGELMLMCFGARKPGRPELAAWRTLLAKLPSTEAVVA